MKQAFDKLRRNGLFFKLVDRIEDVYWRALVNYFSKSSGIVRINGRSSEEFQIVDGVKQNGVLSPFLFNFYINELIKSCVKNNIGAWIGPHNVSVISYCDDITLLSSSIFQTNELLSMCGAYADKWRIEFSVDK